MNIKNENEAIIALKIHIKKLEKQKRDLNKKFDYCHSKEFQEERSRLVKESLSMDRLKEIEKMPDAAKALKALDELKKRNKAIDKRLDEMKKLSDYWTIENIEKNNDEIFKIERKIEQCEIAMMFVPKWI
jgi:hypothetical protein